MLHLVFEHMSMDLRKYMDVKVMDDKKIKSFLYQVKFLASAQNEILKYIFLDYGCHVVLPQTTSAAPRPETAKLAGQPGRSDYQNCRFWFGTSLRSAAAGVHSRGGDPLVQGPRNPARVPAILVPCGHLVDCLHLRRDGELKTPFPGRLGNRPDLPHL
jgi:hypothetical protein